MSLTRRASTITWALLAALTLAAPAATLAGDRSGTEVTPPQVIPKHQRAPEFPPAAKAARIQGEVTVRVTVLPTGLPDKVTVLHSSHTRVGFEEAAVAAVERWRFIPATYDGVPVEYETQYRLTFGRPGMGITAGGANAARASRAPETGAVALAPAATPPANSGGSAGSRTTPRRR